MAWPALVSAQTGAIDAVQTDKARYNPGAAVQFRLDLQGAVTGTQQVQVTYRHLGQVVGSQTVAVSSNTPTWSWTPPTDDYRGYLAELEVLDGVASVGTGTIAVDVSSDWAKFPRYGFVSDYGFLSNGAMDTVIENLNRHHINGLQFYDWQDKHHQPLAGTPGSPDFNWKDIANRDNFRNTVNGYIDRAHDHNMTAMAYNLVYAANDDDGAAADGVLGDWHLYTDPGGVNRDINPLPAGWKSDLYLTNPDNPGWRSYLAQQTAEAFAEYNFDGWHMDQLGDRGPVFDANGAPVDLSQSFGAFVDAMAANPALSGKRFVMNAVNQYGQAGIAQSGVDFLYSEVWEGNETYNDLLGVLQTNHALSGGQLNSVLAAYMNYDQATAPGAFNTPGVLLTDAVIFAAGGAHIELGEHMLAQEYFPNDNLQTPADLQQSLIHYYEFLVAYQNLLRDGGTFEDNPLESSAVAISQGVAQVGAVASLNKRFDDKEVFQLVNFTDAVHLEWRDNAGNQAEPTLRTNLDLRFQTERAIDGLWTASPDVDAGLPKQLGFTQLPNGVAVATLPSLKYWSMLVAEGQTPQAFDNAEQAAYSGGWNDGTGGGSGFGDWKLTAQSSSGGFAGFFLPSDAANAHDIDNAGAGGASTGTAWASFANKGSGIDRATAYRAFDDSLDGAGDAFTLTLEHGLITGQVGVALRNGNVNRLASDYADNARFQLYFEGGDATYTLLDGSGVAFDTGVSFTDYGLSLELTLTSADTYDLTLWRYNETDDLAPQRFDFFDRALAGAGDIESFALFQFDAAGGATQGDVYWNHLRSETVVNLLPGDANADGDVDLLDFDILSSNFGGGPGLTGGAAVGDFNGDGNIDLLDFDILAGNFGAGAPPATVPEPASLAIVATGLLALRRRRSQV
ncbi:MAG: glycoside hydrolase family 66 protein [Planctomycetota bacterium]